MKSLPLLLFPVAFVIVGHGCTTAPTQRGSVEALQLRVSNQKVRLLTRTYAEQFGGTIEVTADRIAEQTDEIPVRRALLLWKLQGISAIFGAAFHLDPVISFLDLATLSAQMRDFFQTGPGSEVLGPLSPQAAEACNAMWELAIEIGDSIRGPVGTKPLGESLEDWIQQHPIDNWQFEREPVAPHIYLILDDQKLTLGGSVVAIEERIDDLSAQVTFINTKLLDRARWQAELLLLDAESNLPLDSLRLLLHASNSTMNNLDAFLESVPTLIGRERAAALLAVGKEREIALQALHAELEQLQAFVQSERNSAALLTHLPCGSPSCALASESSAASLGASSDTAKTNLVELCDHSHHHVKGPPREDS
jgi:hypothetical protein